MNSFIINLEFNHPILAMILGGLALVINIGILILIPIMYYRFSSGLYMLAKKNELSNAWVSYLPILQMYIIVKVIGEVSIFGFRIPSLEIILPILTALSILRIFEIGTLPITYLMLQIQMANSLGSLYTFIIWLGKISSVISTILTFVTIYNLYRIYRSNSIIKMVIVSIITLGIAIPFYIYNIGKDSSNDNNGSTYIEL